MSVHLLHVRFKVSSKIAGEQLDRIWEDAGGDTFLISDEGNTAHFLVPGTRGASLLAHQLEASLSQSLVEDFGIVDVSGLSALEAEPSDDNFAVGEDEYLASDEDEYEEETIEEWWEQFGPPARTSSGFRRRGLLLITEDERRDDSKPIADIRRYLGPEHDPHWHGRNCLFLTFWGVGDTDDLLSIRPLARAVGHPMFREVYAFGLTNDFAAKHDQTSTLASWFARDPSITRSSAHRGRAQPSCAIPAKLSPKARRPLVIERLGKRSRQS